MTKTLYSPHSTALSLLYADIEAVALQQAEVFIGTAGSLVERTNAGGFRYYAHQFYDGARKQRERYVAGPVGKPEADAAAEELRVRIREVKDLVPTLRMLGREGFNLADPRTYATVAALHNQGIFRAGGMLIGSHAYGVLLNRLGAQATPFTTEDVDIARSEALAFEELPDRPLLEMLRDSGIDFVEVPSLHRKKPSTSFKQKGKARFHVDLLVPSRGETYSVVEVPELGAHATGLPYLRYLLAESQDAALLAREGCCAVRVPLPERFAVHKLVTSRLRTGRTAKSDKDVEQACVLMAVLGDTHPGAIEAAVRAVPRRAATYLRQAIPLARDRLESAAPRAWEEMRTAAEG